MRVTSQSRLETMWMRRLLQWWMAALFLVVVGRGAVVMEEGQEIAHKEDFGVQFAEIPGIILNHDPAGDIGETSAVVKESDDKIDDKEGASEVETRGDENISKEEENIMIENDEQASSGEKTAKVEINNNIQQDGNSDTLSSSSVAKDTEKSVKEDVREVDQGQEGNDKVDSSKREKDSHEKESHESHEEEKTPLEKLASGSVAAYIQEKVEEEFQQELEPIGVEEDNISSSSLSSSSEQMITAVSTTVVSTLGTTTTAVTTVTLEPAYTKILRCIYGCNTLTVEPGMAKQATTTVTALPVTLPCSLVSCPPCGCTTQFISVTGCPLIVTETPPDSYVFITADTVTFITVTTTVTSCTATTTVSSIVTVTVTTTGSVSVTTVTSTSTVRITTVTRFSTQRRICTPTPTANLPTDQCPAGYDWDGTVEEPKLDCCGKPLPPPDCPCQPCAKPPSCGSCNRGNRVPGCLSGNCRAYYFNKVGNSTVDDEMMCNSNDQVGTTVTKTNPNCIKGDVCAPPRAAMDPAMNGPGGNEGGGICPAGCIAAHHAVPTPATQTIPGSVCSTFVICNPRQFSCPSQVKWEAQLPAFLDAWGLNDPNRIPGGFPYAYPAGNNNNGMSQPPVDYLGYDGTMHGIGSSPGGKIAVNGTDQVKTTTTSSTSATSSNTSATTKDARLSAASKNHAIRRSNILSSMTIVSVTLIAWSSLLFCI